MTQEEIKKIHKTNKAGYEKLAKQFEELSERYRYQIENPNHKRLEEIYEMVSKRLSMISQKYSTIV